MEHFVFSKPNQDKITEILKQYPVAEKRSGVMPLLDLAQRQCDGWIPQSAINHIAELLDMAPIRVMEVATFYSMFNLKPVGKHHIQLCGTTPCWLRGAADLRSACEKHLGIKNGETTSDGVFTLTEVECLGACVNAPMVQINDDFYEDLDEKSMVDILDTLIDGKNAKPGSYNGRHGSKAKDVDNA